MKKIFTITGLVLLFFVIDNTLAPFILVKSYIPSFLFVFIICYSIVNGKWDGLWIGILSGALQDIYFINGFGINTLTNMLVCILAGILGEAVFKEKIIIPVLSIFVLSLIKNGMVFIILYLLGIDTFYKNIIYMSLYNFVISVFLYKAVYNLSQKDFMKKEWRF